MPIFKLTVDQLQRGNPLKLSKEQIDILSKNRSAGDVLCLAGKGPDRLIRQMRPRYVLFGLSLTQDQIETMVTAAREGSEVTLGLRKSQLQGEDTLGLTQTQIAHISKNKSAGHGAHIKFSKTQLKTMLMNGGLSDADALAGGAAAVTSPMRHTRVPLTTKRGRIVEYTWGKYVK
jgi:hypothetical protein